MDKETRAERFKEVGIAYTVSTRPNVICGDAFADDDVIKQFNRSPQFEAGAEYGYNFAIEQVCEWLEKELKGYIAVQACSTSADISVNVLLDDLNLLDDLEQAMKGD